MTHYRGTKIYVGIQENKLNEVKQHMKLEYSDFDIEYDPQVESDVRLLMPDPEESKSQVAANADHSEASLSSPTLTVAGKFIGPGSAIFRDDNCDFMRQYQKDTKPQRLYNPKECLLGTMMNSENYGTLGCFVGIKNNPSKEEEIYCLTVRHIFNTNNDNAPLEDNNDPVHVVAGFFFETDLGLDHKMFDDYTDVRITAGDVIYLTKGFNGIFGLKKIDGEEFFVDVALLGPVEESALDVHKEFKPNISTAETSGRHERHRLQTRGTDGLLCKKVKKIGAKTGYTEGIILITDYHSASTETTMKAKDTFVVTSLKDGEPEINGQFAIPGDSGAVVLLQSEKKAIGLIHSRRATLHLNRTEYKNVIICVKLECCIKALQEKLKINQHHLSLYYYYLEPLLRVAKQVLPGDKEKDESTSQVN